MYVYEKDTKTGSSHLSGQVRSYRASGGDFTRETLWATQAQIAGIFGTTPQNITLHLKNVYKEKELSEQATCKEYLQVQKEGKREIVRVNK